MYEEVRNSVKTVRLAAGLYSGCIASVTEKYNVRVALEALCMCVGRWFASQDQSHVNHEGLTKRQLMHAMVDYYFDQGLREHYHTRLH